MLACASNVARAYCSQTSLSELTTLSALASQSKPALINALTRLPLLELPADWRS